MAFLEVRDLVQRYRTLEAVAGISLTLQRGRCFGLLGPNGAGKTTTIEIMEGIHRPTSGQVLYQGEPLGKRFREQAGIMFQSTALQEFITVRETLQLFGRFYSRGTPLERLIEECSLEGFIDRDAHRLSGGQRQRLLLAIALVNDPEVLFLDEPTTGLDPQARRNFWDLVGRIKERGKTVLLTTHYMEEAYALCDEIAIMDHGRILAQGTPRALLAAHFDDVVLELPRESFPEAPPPLAATLLQRNGNVEILTSDVNATIRALLAADVSLARLQVRSRTLEDLFLELTGRGLRA